MPVGSLAARSWAARLPRARGPSRGSRRDVRFMHLLVPHDMTQKRTKTLIYRDLIEGQESHER